MLATDEIITVTPNVAHGLVDSGKAVLFTGEEKVVKPKRTYKPRKMRPTKTKYNSRQMRVSASRGKRKRQKVMGGYKSK